MSDIANVGDVFALNLAEMFIEGFDESLKGTPEYAEMKMTYGIIEWIGDGDYPGMGNYDGYDWKVAPFERITTDHGWLELRVAEVDHDEEWVKSDVVGYYGMPQVQLTFDEFHYYAVFE